MTLFIVVGVAASVVGLFASAGAFRRMFAFQHETSRKVVHVIGAAVAAALPAVIPSRSAVIAIAGLLFVLLPLGARFGWFPAVVRTDRTIAGPVWFLFAFFLLLLFEPDPSFFATSCLVFGFADALACLVGRRWGRRPPDGSAGRTLLGSLTFAVVATTIVAGMSGRLGLVDGPTVPLALGIGLVVANVEAISPSAFDNFSIPMVTALLLRFGAHAEPSRGSTIVLGTGFAIALGTFAYRRRWLTVDGAHAVTGIVAANFLCADWRFPGLLVIFFATSSVLTRLGGTRALDDHDATTGRRAIQVLAFGLFPTIMAALYSLTSDVRFAVCATVAIAAATADTWATEIGRFAPRWPRDILRFTRVEPGTSGGVTLLGLLASLAGAVLIGLVAFGWGVVDRRSVPLVAVLGFAGSIVDSVLGAGLQAKYQCRNCQRQTEAPFFCHGDAAGLARGVGFVRNHTVNLAASSAMGLLYLLVERWLRN